VTTTADSELAGALTLDRDIRRRGAPETIVLPEGIVVRHPGLASVYDLNMVILAAPPAPELGAAEIAALAERWLGHLGHRQVGLPDAGAAERVSPELTRSGWVQRRTVFMVFHGDPADAARDPRAREISAAELQALQRTSFEQDDFGSDAAPGLPARLVAAQAALRAGTRARCFGAGEDGGLQSMCTLFLDPDSAGRRAAMVEQVATLAAYRERGLAKAAVSAAILAAGQWGAELLVVPADADDWPQLLYAGLGFGPVGRQSTFTRRGLSGEGAV
jgi:GNAT superfamily N-acetyltransferase